MDRTIYLFLKRQRELLREALSQVERQMETLLEVSIGSSHDNTICETQQKPENPPRKLPPVPLGTALPSKQELVDRALAVQISIADLLHQDDRRPTNAQKAAILARVEQAERTHSEEVSK